MMLLKLGNRQERQNHWLGATTALVAGLVNVCSVMAFFAFSSNVTGHVAIFVEEIAKGHWHQVSVVSAWMFAFMFGAFVAHLLVSARDHHAGYASHAPLVLQILVLTGTAYYGHQHYLETLRETEYLVGALLFAMGLQNGTVSTVSNSVVRTTHLTGLFTDLGMELSSVVQRRYRRDRSVLFKLKLHLLILGSYMLGGLGGGLLYLRFGFKALYVASVMLVLILLHDLLVASLLRESRSFSRRDADAKGESRSAL